MKSKRRHPGCLGSQQEDRATKAVEELAAPVLTLKLPYRGPHEITDNLEYIAEDLAIIHSLPHAWQPQKPEGCCLTGSRKLILSVKMATDLQSHIH